MSRLVKSGLLMLCLGALLGGCGDDEDPEKQGGDGDGDTQGGDGDTQEGDDAGTPMGVDPAGFGTVCTADAECTTNAPYCALQPSATSGYCTRQNCTVEDPAATCPATWTCLDLNMFSPGLGTMCRKP